MSSQISIGGNLSVTLTIVFVVLKLVHVIAWSWWWVLSPLWISVGLCLAVMAVVGITFAVCAGVVWLMEIRK